MSSQRASVDSAPGRMRREKPRALGWVGRINAVWKRFTEDNGPMMAAAMTFFALLSIVPLLLVALAVLGFFVSSPQAAIQNMQDVVSRYLPGRSGVSAFQYLANAINLQQTLQNLMTARGVALATGILALIWTAMQLFIHAMPPMNAAFNTKETRSWVQTHLVALGVLIVASILFLLSIATSSIPNVLRGLHLSVFGLSPNLSGWVDVLFVVVGIALNAAMFAVIYKYLPNARVPWASALVGGVVAGVLWEIAKKAFAVYLAHFGSYDKLYGAMGGVVLLVTWMYYSSFILLLGAEMAAVFQFLRVRAGLPGQPGRDELEQQALMAVYGGQAVPLAASPESPYAPAALGDPRGLAKETAREIRGHLRAISETAQTTAHGVRTSSERVSAQSAFAKPLPTAAERRDTEASPSAEERRPSRRKPRQAPDRALYGALGGSTPAPETVIRLEKNEPAHPEYTDWQKAEHAYQTSEHAPAYAAKEEAREAVQGIKEHIQAIAGSMRQARKETRPSAPR